MGISDRKRSIDVPVNINLDLNQEIKPNQFLVDNNIKSGDFVSRKKSGNILAGSKLNVDGQGIFNVKIFKNEIVKKLSIVSPGSEGIPPTPSVTPVIILTTTPTPSITPTVTSTITPTPSTTPPPSFVSVWRTTGATESITLPYIVSGTYSGTIDWGDGNTSTNSYANRTHTYSTPGDYTVIIYGTLNGWSFNNTGDKLKIREILRWGPWKGQNSYGGSFWGCSNLILTGVTDTPNLTNVNVTYMFTNCSSITTINNINSWDVSNVTSFERIFLNCTSFNQDISNWNVSNCENFTGMFYECNVFNNGLSSGVSGNGLNNWVISSTGTSIIMSSMFADCWSFNQDVSSWNMSKVTDISIMFYQCFVFNQPIQNWERTSPNISTMSGVTTMSSTFRYAYLFNQPIGNWNVSNLVDGTGLFGVATSFNQPLSGWNVSNLVYAGAMFASMSFNQNIGNWDVSKVVDMQVMFQNNGVFNNGGSPTINNWNVSGVTNMSGTFYGCSNFNQPLSGWNVGNVSIMSVTFYACSLFNQPIGNWNVSGVTTMSGMFALSTTFNQDIGGWDVSKVTDFSSMFSGANNFNNGGSPSISGWTINTTTNILMPAMFATANQFNQPIGSWNVSKVTNMSQMFYANNMFNQPLSGWNVSNVNYTVQMFAINPTFNQPIGNWNVSNVINMQEMFYGSPAFNQDIGNWNISGVTNFINFMTFKTPITLSTTNLDSIYNGWSTKNPKPNLSINFGSANYTTSVSGAGKAILTGSTGSGGYGWTITDGGGI